MKKCPIEQKATVGASINACKQYVEEVLLERGKAVLAKEEAEEFLKEKIDISLPGSEEAALGGKHVIKKVLDDVVDIFVRFGFCVREAPNIESEKTIFLFLISKEIILLDRCRILSIWIPPRSCVRTRRMCSLGS